MALDHAVTTSDLTEQGTTPATIVSQTHCFAQDDLDYLKRRGIPYEMAEAAGLRGARAQEATKLLGREELLGSSGLVIPYPGVMPPYYRIRFHDPEAVGARFLTLAGRDVPLYQVPAYFRAPVEMPRTLDDVLVVVESPIKALAMAAVGLEAVGLSGTGTTLAEKHGAKQLNSSWPRARVQGRDVIVLFDAGRSNNPNVARDEARLVRALGDAGASVRVAALPLSNDGEDQGPDDFVATTGATALYAILEAAVPGDPTMRVQAEKQAGRAVQDLLDDLPFMTSMLEASNGVAAKTRDALINAGLTKKDIATAIKDARERATRVSEQDGPALGDDLGVVDGVICRTLGGTVPLCNFNARIVEEHVLDDGVEEGRTLEIEGALQDGTPLPRIKVKPDELITASWPLLRWGTRAIVATRQGVGDNLRLALQLFSTPRVTRTYAHTGWRKLTDATGIDGGLPVFLHGGGAVGGTDVAVRLEDRLAYYRLPEVPVDPAEAVRLSLELLALGPDEVTIPLLGMVYRAPLQSMLPADVTVMLVGKTGSLKTSLAKMAAAHYGERLADHPATTFQASTAAVEMVLNRLKDVLVLVDDFKPRNDKDAVHGKAHAIFASVGDQEGRGRMQSDGSVRPARPPRALVLATGETPPAGESTVARLLLLNLEKDGVDLRMLSAAQRTAPRLAHAMTAYLLWLQPRLADIESELKRKHADLRSKFEKVGAGGHLRSPNALAHVALGYEYFLPFAEGVGALTSEESEKLRRRVNATLENLGSKGVATSRETDPVQRFLDFLRALLVQGKVRTETDENKGLGRTAGPGEPLGEPIGWEDEDHLYLLGEVTYSAVKRAMEQAGEDLPHGERVLWRRLRETSVIEPGDREGRLTVRKDLGLQRREVISLKRKALWPDDGDGPDDRGPKGGGPGGGRGAQEAGASDNPDFGDENRTSNGSNRTTEDTNRTTGSAGASRGKGGQPIKMTELPSSTSRTTGPVGPVGPLRKEESRERKDDTSPAAEKGDADASPRETAPTLQKTGPTGPSAQPTRIAQLSAGQFGFRPDQLDQTALETVADGLAYLRLPGTAKRPVWCVKTAERLLGVTAVGTVAARRRELEARLDDAGLAQVAALEFALLPVIAAMQAAGLGIDTAAWATLVENAEHEAARSQAELAELGLKNPLHGQQVLAALASRGLVVSSTRESALSPYTDDALVSALRRFRRSAGFLKSTGRAVLAAVCKGSGRVHAIFDPLSAPTGRMACSKPNLLSIPKAAECRRCIVPAPGHKLIVADYSAIELRVLAEVTKDPVLSRVFADGGDPHTSTAATLLNKSASEITTEERQHAKAVNFGFAFGMGPAKFVEYARETYGLTFTPEAAKQMHHGFLAAYPGVAAWQRRIRKEMPLEVRTIGGRRRLFQSDTAGYCERLNTPVQGTAADGLKLAMVLLHERLASHAARIMLAVHDELLVEAPEPSAEDVRTVVEQAMVEGMSRYVRSIPVNVEASVRRSWAQISP